MEKEIKNAENYSAADGNDLQNFQKAVDYAVAEQKKKKRKKRWIILGCIVAVIVLIAVVSNRPKQYDFSNPAQKVTVDTILSDFNSNATQASEKYSDQVIAVTGKVGAVEDSYLVIHPYDDDNWLYSVNAYMENASDMTNTKVGNTITVEGVCDKTTLFGDVKMEQCVYAEQFAVKPAYDTPEKVSIDTLLTAYKENQVSADAQYKGKTLEITGKVSYIGDDYAVLSPEKEELWDFDLDAQIEFETTEDFQKIKEDKKTTVIAECYGAGTVYTVKLCRAIVK